MRDAIRHSSACREVSELCLSRRRCCCCIRSAPLPLPRVPSLGGLLHLSSDSSRRAASGDIMTLALSTHRRQGVLVTIAAAVMTMLPTVAAFPGDRGYYDEYFDHRLLTVGAVCMIITGVVTALLFISLVRKRAAPRLGSRLRPGVVPRDPASCSFRVIPLLLVVSSLVTICLSLTADQWSVSDGSFDGYDDEMGYKFGLIGWRTDDGYGQSYKDMLDEWHSGGRRMILVGSILATAFVSFALLLQLVHLIFALISLVSPRRSVLLLIPRWRLQSMTCVLTFGLLLEWVFGPFFGLRHELNQLSLGRSWITMAVSWAIDAITIMYYRRAARYTTNPAVEVAPATVVVVPTPIATTAVEQTGEYTTYPVYPTVFSSQRAQYAPLASQPPLPPPAPVPFAYPVQASFAPVVYATPILPQPQQQPHGYAYAVPPANHVQLAEGYTAPPSHNPNAYTRV